MTLQITSDKVGGADRDLGHGLGGCSNAFENAKALQKEGSVVVATDIAGAGFEPATFGL